MLYTITYIDNMSDEIILKLIEKNVQTKDPRDTLNRCEEEDMENLTNS